MAEDDEKKALDERLEKLEKTIEGLANLQGKFQENFETVSDTLLGINERLSAKPDKKSESEDLSERDLETMSRGKLMETMLAKVGNLIDSKVKPVEEKVESETITRKQHNVAKQIRDAETKYKDFWDWRDEMGQIAKAHPGLAVEDAYVMARGKNQDKAQELDDKYTEKKDEEEEKPAFGGLFPNSGNLSSEELAKDMTSDEAADLAWEKTMAGVVLPSE